MTHSIYNQAQQKREQIHEAALKSWQEHKYRSTLVIGTGVGKARILINAIRQSNPTTVLVLVNTEILRDVELYAEFIKWSSADLLEKCTFMCYQSAYRIDGHWDMIVCDEVDAAVTPEYFKFMSRHTSEKLLCLTATLPDAKRNILEQYAPISFEYSTQQAQRGGVLNKTKIWGVNFSLGTEPNYRYSKYDKESKRRIVKYISENDMYNLLEEEYLEIQLEQAFCKEPKEYAIVAEKLKGFSLRRKNFLSNLQSSVRIVEKLKREILHVQKQKVMIFSESIKQAEKLSVFTYHSKNSENDNLRYFNEGRINEIAVVKSVNRGINVDGLNNEILESYSSSPVEWQQRHGRCCRLEPIYTAFIYVLIPVFIKKYKDGKSERKYTCAMDYLKKATNGFDLAFANFEYFKFKNV